MAEPARAYQGSTPFEEHEEEREPFGVFYNDDTVQEIGSQIAAQRGWSTTNIRKGGLNTALRLLGIAPLPKFLVVDIDGEEIEEACKVLTEIARMGSMVVALGTVNDVQYFRKVMRAGVRDYLVKPVTADTLGEVLASLEQPDSGGRIKGRLVGVIGARGGVGTTTIAINTAWIMSERLNRRTALVDMDIYSGSIALALDMEPTRGLREAFDDPKRVDEVFLQNAMNKVGKNLHVLATEEALDDQVRMSDDKMATLAQMMHGNFDMSVLDLPRHFALREATLLGKCDDFVIVTELTLQSLRDANRLRTLLGMRNPQATIHVVANQIAPGTDITVKEFENGLESPLRCQFPVEKKILAKSSIRGEPLAALNPKHRMVGDLHKLCLELAGIPEEARKKGFLQRAFGKK
ncbi:AAA family ATPase [Amaricoccus macauensis]|uniref:AAA family ATPase n=1 Tax=Amaricoccus macauensis TaxID=57001 RepID=UPI003C7C44CB